MKTAVNSRGILGEHEKKHGNHDPLKLREDVVNCLYKTIVSGGKELNEKIKISKDQGLTFRQVIANDLGICMSFYRHTER